MPNVHDDIFLDILTFLNLYVSVCESVYILIRECTLLLNIKYISFTGNSTNKEKTDHL